MKRSKKEEILDRFTAESSKEEVLFRKDIEDLETEAYLRGYREATMASCQQIISRKDKEILRLNLVVEKIMSRLDQIESRKK